MVDQTTIDRVAAAIESAELGYSMRQVRLVDGINTYTLTIDGMPTEEFTDNEDGGATDQVYARIREVKQRQQAEAVIAALSVQIVPDGWTMVPTIATAEMQKAGERWSGLPSQTWTDMIDAAPMLGIECSGKRRSLSEWSGWDESNLPWSRAKHQDAVCRAVFGPTWAMEDAAALVGFINQTWGASPQTNVACPCTLIEQDEDCPVGYPSLLCGVCDGKGHTTQEQVTALACEMVKVASDMGEPEDPFAAWETISLIESHRASFRKALDKIAGMVDDENADLDEAIEVATRALVIVKAEGSTDA